MTQCTIWPTISTVRLIILYQNNSYHTIENNCSSLNALHGCHANCAHVYVEPSIVNLHVCCTRSHWCLLSAPCIVQQTCLRTSLHAKTCERSHWGSSGTPMSRWWGAWRRRTDHSQGPRYKTTDSVSGELREDKLITSSQRVCYKDIWLGKWVA